MTAPLYISIAWSLIISYQLFTQTAVYSIANFLAGFWPTAGELLIPNTDVIVFVHAFAWIFVLSSVIPIVILGKERSVLLQFFLCLTVTLVAVSIEGIFTILTGQNPAGQMQALSTWFQNPLIAGFYLSVPYLFMFYLDLRSRKEWRKMEETETVHFEEATMTEQTVNVVAPCQGTDGSDQNFQPKGRVNFLYGASAACFLLAFFTLWLGGILLNTVFTTFYKLFYVAIFLILGMTLLGLGLYSKNIQKQQLTHLHEEEQRLQPFEHAELQYNEPIGATETLPQALSEASTEELIKPTENLIEVQIQEQYCEPQPLPIKRYDVTHPKDVVDSQC